MSVNSKLTLRVLFSLVVVLAFSLGHASAQTDRKIPSGAYVLGLNNHGDTVGYYGSEAFLFKDGIMTFLGSLGGSSVATAINDRGDIAGYSLLIPNCTVCGGYHAFLVVNGVMKDLGTLPGAGSSLAYAINDKGQIVGESGGRAFLYSNGVMTDLGTLGGSYSAATALNNKGEIVGYSYYIGGGFAHHAFLYSGGVMRDLGTLGGANSEAFGINDFGQVVGSSQYTGGPQYSAHAFVYSNGIMKDLGSLGGQYSIARGINTFGDIAGESNLAGITGPTRAFFYSGGIMKDVTPSLPATVGVPAYVYAINDAGQVLGNSEYGPFLVETGNRTPICYAGHDLNVVRPAIANLNGFALDDGNPRGSSFITTWSKVSGPGQVIFNSNSPQTTAKFVGNNVNADGVYVLRLSGTDGINACKDDVSVIVSGNHPPVVNAGTDVAVTVGPITNRIPATIHLQSTAVDDGVPGSPLIIRWATLSGPPGLVWPSNNNTLGVDITVKNPGTWELRLYVSDGELSAIDTVTVTATEGPPTP